MQPRHPISAPLCRSIPGLHRGTSSLLPSLFQLKTKHRQDEGFRETYQPVKELPFYTKHYEDEPVFPCPEVALQSGSPLALWVWLCVCLWLSSAGENGTQTCFMDCLKALQASKRRCLLKRIGLKFLSCRTARG